MKTECPHCGASLPSTQDAFCPECFQGLDEPTAAQLAAGGTAIANAADPPTASAGVSKTTAGPLPPSIGNIFLVVGAVICVCGCVFAVLKTLYGLWTLRQVASIITVSTADSTLLIAMVMLDGFVWFCLCAALVVVFMRVARLKEQGGAEKVLS